MYLNSFMLIFLCGLIQYATAQISSNGIISLDPFTEITVSDGIEIDLVKGEKAELRIISTNYDDDEIKIIQRGRELAISVDGLFTYETKIKLRLTFQDLYKIHARSGANIEVKDTIFSDQLNVKAGGGGWISFKASVNELVLKATEGAEIYALGKADYKKCYAQTAGKIHAYEMITNNTYAKVNTGGKADVYALDEVEASINTGGKLNIYGNPNNEYIKSGLGGTVARKY